MDAYPDAEKHYLPFMVNRALSFSPDTLLYANEMNCQYMLDNRMQFDYLYHSVRRRKRWDKLIKKNEVEQERLKVIMEHYKVSSRKAKDYLRLLTEEQVEALRTAKGGRNAK
jgi:predicted DNA binding protein